MAAGFCFLTGTAPARDVELCVKEGSPLHIGIGEKAPVRIGQPVRGRLLHPVHVYDREVLPAGTLVLGHIAGVKPPPRIDRVAAYLQGRLRTKREALVAFDTLVAPDGRSWRLDAAVTPGGPATVRVAAGGGAQGSSKDKTGLIQAAKEKAGAAIANHEIVRLARSVKPKSGGFSRAALTGAARKTVLGMGGALRNELLSYWPFGGQTLRPGTSFTAVLREPLNFGVRRAEGVEIESPLLAPPPDSVVQARLLETIDSKTARIGSPVRAVVMRPLVSPDGRLILPEGAEVVGEVSRAIPARRFGRNGKLQIRFTKIEGPGAEAVPVSGNLEAVEAANGRGRMRLDEEGGASIPFSKRRLIAPAIAVTLASAAVPDEESTVAIQGGAPGWSGFGLAGLAVSLTTRTAAGPLGWWGAASSVYFNLIRKAGEVVFPAHTVLEIRFGRPAPQAGNILAAAEHPRLR